MRSFFSWEKYNELQNIGPLKAPGLDGFHAAFFQKVWDAIGGSVVSFVWGLLEGGDLPPVVAEALVVLVPEVENSHTIEEFSPISLYNMMFKLITKMMESRIKGIMAGIVSLNQCRFVPYRQITDNIITRK